MFSYFFGTIKDIKFNKIILEVNEIGFEIFVKQNEKFALNEKIRIYIYDSFKEDKIFLYGFKRYRELDLFLKLIEVNGIGPKKAIQILSKTNTEELIFLIKNKKVSDLKKIKGAGVFAESIVLKLADVIDKNEDNIFRYSNVYFALKSLGYPLKDINDSINKLNDGLSDEEALEEVIRGIKNVKAR